jgi:hypothetical protein
LVCVKQIIYFLFIKVETGPMDECCRSFKDWIQENILDGTWVKWLAHFAAFLKDAGSIPTQTGKSLAP